MGNYQTSKTENIDINENESSNKLDNEVNVIYKVQNNFQDYIYLVLIRTLYGSENKVMFSYNYMDIYNYIESFKKNIYDENSFINVEESPIENQYIYKKYESMSLENLNEKYINSINQTKLLYSVRFYKELKNIINPSQNHISSLYIYKVYKMDHVQCEEETTEEENTEEETNEDDTTEEETNEEENTEEETNEEETNEDDTTEEETNEEEQTSEEQTSEEQTSEEQTSEEQTSEEQTSEEQTSEEDIVEEIEEQLEDVEGDLPPLQNLLKLLPPPIRVSNSGRTGSMSLPSSPRFIRERGLTIIDANKGKEVDNNVDLYNVEELPPLPPSDNEDN